MKDYNSNVEDKKIFFDSNQKKVNDPNKPKSFFERDPLKEFFSFTFFKAAGVFLVFLLFLYLWNQVGNNFTLLMFTILPLFLGYGFSYLLQPVNLFFQKFFSKKISKILVFIIFLILTVGIVIGLFFIFFIQLNRLYLKLVFQNGSDDFQQFLNALKVNNPNFIKNLNITEKTDASFKFHYAVLDKNSTTYNNYVFLVKNNDTSGIFILLMSIAARFEYLKDISLNLMTWINDDLSNYNYLQSLIKNWQFIAMFLYLFFFTIIIAAFSLGEGEGFWKKIWNYLMRKQDPVTANQFNIDLKKNLSAWFKGLLIVEFYIFIFSALFIFIAGIVNPKNSSYGEAVFVLALFVAICNLVPYIGPVVGFIPIISIGLIDIVKNAEIYEFINWLPLIIAFFGVWLTQLGESVVVSPLVFSYKIKLKPTLIIIALAASGVLFGIVWLPLTIPVILVIKIIYKTFYQEREKINERKQKILQKRTRS